MITAIRRFRGRVQNGNVGHTLAVLTPRPQPYPVDAPDPFPAKNNRFPVPTTWTSLPAGEDSSGSVKPEAQSYALVNAQRPKDGIAVPTRLQRIVHRGKTSIPSRCLPPLTGIPKRRQGRKCRCGSPALGAAQPGICRDVRLDAFFCDTHFVGELYSVRSFGLLP